MGAAGLLTRARLLKSGIGQPLLDSNEIHVKGSGRGFFLLNTKPARVKLFRGGQDIPPKLTVCRLASELDRSPTEPCWDHCAAGHDAQCAHGSCEGCGGEADLHSDKQTQVPLFFPLPFPRAVTL